jgi:DNA-binding GntR family transcriptional regulator
MAKRRVKRVAKKDGAKGTLADQAYESIKERLVSARYAPGRFLQESDICTDIRLGRTPVHQALHRLHQEGLLEIIPRKGILIKSDSLSEIMVALEARELVESYCALQCAVKASDKDLGELRDILDRYDSVREGGDKAVLMAIDRAFHARICEIAGNALLVDFLRPIHERMSRMWFLPHWQFHDFGMTETEHERLFDALKSRDGVAASAAMSEHIASLKRRIMEARIA